MKTRIKKTTTVVDGVENITYQAEVFVWQDQFSWYPAGRKLVWEDSEYDAFSCDWTEVFGELGSLERAKKIIDTLLMVIAEKKAQKFKEKAIKDSTKTEVIKYP